MKQIKTLPLEFEKFHNLLIEGAKICGFTNYTPWYFPVTKNEKDPDAIEIAKRASELTPCCSGKWIKNEHGKNVCEICQKTSKGGWTNPYACLTFEEALKRLEEGKNVGIAARVNDPLVIIDIDNKNFTSQMPSNTLTCVSRTRLGIHGFGFSTDEKLKRNISSSTCGEIRASDQYVVVCGSFVPCTPSGLEKKVEEGSIERNDINTILNDTMCGLYTLKDASKPRIFIYEDLPQFFRDEIKKQTELQPQPISRVQINNDNIHPLYKITFDNILGNKWNNRMPHPLHDSETGQNFNIENEHLVNCWRHLVSLTPVQFLAAKAGYCSCEQAGNGHKNSGRGRSIVTGNYDAILAAFNQAVKDGLLPSDCQPPRKYIEKKEEVVSTPIISPDWSEALRKAAHARNTGKICELLVTKIMFENVLLTMEDSGDVYVYKDGIYITGGEQLISAKVQKIMIEKELMEKTNNHIVGEVIGHIKRMTSFDRKEFDNHPELLCLENGILNVETKELVPFDPKYKFLSKIPVKYDPEAKCENFDKFVKEIVHENHVAMIYEIFGYCFYRNYKFQNAFMLIGEGSNGKSTLVNTLAEMLGEKNVSAVELAQLTENPFAASNLYGKMANIHIDISDKELKLTGTFKGLTGGDLIQAERKFKNPFFFRNYAKLIFSCNRLPLSYDDTNAYHRRWIIIPFPNTFSEANDNKKLGEVLRKPEELSGILNTSLEALQRLIKQGKFTGETTTEEKRRFYQKLSDPIKCFADDCLTTVSTGRVAKGEIYCAYMTYCKKNGYPIESQQKFGKRLPAIVYISQCKIGTGNEQVEGWRGIELKEEYIIKRETPKSTEGTLLKF